MIAQFKEKKPWSALALVALIALAAVTLTDPVRGQDAADDEKKDATTATREESDTVRDRSVRTERTDVERASESRPRDPRDPGQSLRERRLLELGRDSGTRGGRGGDTTTAEPRRPTSFGRGVPAMDAHMQATFDRKLPELNFTDVPFSDVIEFLRDVTGTNLFVNWRALESVGIDRNAPVNMRMKNVSFATILRLLLDSTAPGLLDYEVDGGVIIITASANAHHQLAPQMMGMGAAAAAPVPAPTQSITRVYDVRDLLGPIHVQRDPQATASDPRLAGLRSTRDAILREYGQEHPKVRQAEDQIAKMEAELRVNPSQSEERNRLNRLQELVSIVQETIGREQPLSVRGFNTKLVVRAAREVQQEVEQLLAMLREDNADTPTRETPSPRK